MCTDVWRFKSHFNAMFTIFFQLIVGCPVICQTNILPDTGYPVNLFKSLKTPFFKEACPRERQEVLQLKVWPAPILPTSRRRKTWWTIPNRKWWGNHQTPTHRPKPNGKWRSRVRFQQREDHQKRGRIYLAFQFRSISQLQILARFTLIHHIIRVHCSYS